VRRKRRGRTLAQLRLTLRHRRLSNEEQLARQSLAQPLSQITRSALPFTSFPRAALLSHLPRLCRYAAALA